MPNSRQKARSAGFSILEIIVGVAILVLLAGLIIPLTKQAIDDAKVAQIIARVEAVGRAAKKHWFDTNQSAVEDQIVNRHDLCVTLGLPGWKGPYLDQPLNASLNPWGGVFKLDPQASGRVPMDGYVIGGVALPSKLGGQVTIGSVPEKYAKLLDMALDGEEGDNKGICEYETVNLVGAPAGICNVHVYLFRQ